MVESRNLLQLLAAPDGATRDGICGWRDGLPVSYDDFVARVRAWQALLDRCAGERFALYLSDSLEFGAALLGAWQADKTIYLPGDNLPATCASLRATVDGFLGQFPDDCVALFPSADDATAPHAGFKPLAPDFAGLVVYTSGSTGAAQSIPKKMSQLASEVATLECLFGTVVGVEAGAGADAPEVVATVTHQHIYGLLFKLLWPLVAARPIHARSFAFPEELVPLLAARDCILISSPAHLKRLPDNPAWARVAPRLRAVFSSGGPLPPEVAQIVTQRLGRAPIEVYGSSETGGIAWRQSSESKDDDGWTPMPGVDWRIAADPADDAALEVRSPHLPDANWLRLADRAQQIAGGRFRLRGRADRIVKIEEKRVSLDAIQSRLAASPLVAEVRVLMLAATTEVVTDIATDLAAGRRQRIAAFIVPSASGRATLADIGKLAFNRLLRGSLIDAVERVALPRSWRYLDALPVNAQGKTTHAELLALLDQDDASPTVRPTLPRQRLLERDALRAVFELVAPSDLLYFDGHFSQAPILPGVAQLDWAIAFGRAHFDLPPQFMGVQALKFQRVIQPEMPFQLELQHDRQKSSLSFRFSSAAGQHASGRILFGAAVA